MQLNFYALSTNSVNPQIRSTKLECVCIFTLFFVLFIRKLKIIWNVPHGHGRVSQNVPKYPLQPAYSPQNDANNAPFNESRPAHKFGTRIRQQMLSAVYLCHSEHDAFWCYCFVSISAHAEGATALRPWLHEFVWQSRCDSIPGTYPRVGPRGPRPLPERKKMK